MKHLDPLIAKQVLSRFRPEERLSILDAVRLGDRSREELETWALFCACLAWGGLIAKRNLLISFYRTLPGPFTEFIRNPSQDLLKNIYRGEGSLKLLGLCLAIRDLLDEYGSISNFVKGSKDVPQTIFRLAHVLRKKLDQQSISRKFNLPKVKNTPPIVIGEKRRTNSLKRYCMYFRWMVRDSEPDFGIWNFFDKKDLYHPVDRHVARIIKRWGVLSDDSPNWFNVEIVTEYFREVEPEDPTRFDYHLVTFGQKFCKKDNPNCERCPIKIEFDFDCSL